MIFSYSLGTSTKSEDMYSKSDRKSRKDELEFNTRSKELIEMNLEKYGITSPDQIKIFSDIVEKYNINPTMIIAADQWFRNNDKPEKFNPSLFSDNFGIKQITSLSFESKKEWTFDRKVSLLTYASLLKEILYRSGGVEIVLSSGSGETDYYESYGESGEYDY